MMQTGGYTLTLSLCSQMASLWGIKTVAELTKDQWEEIRAMWAAGGKVKAITKRYGVSRQVLHRKIRSGSWAKDAGELLQRRAKVTGGGLQKDTSVTPENVTPSSKQFADFMEDRNKLLVYHRLSWVELEGIRRDALAVLRGRPTEALKAYRLNDTGEPLLDADGKKIPYTMHLDPKQRVTFASQLFSVYRKAVDSLMLAQEGQRRAHGFDFKMMQEEGDNGDSERRDAELVDGLIKAIDGVNRKAEETLLIEDRTKEALQRLQENVDAHP